MAAEAITAPANPLTMIAAKIISLAPTGNVLGMRYRSSHEGFVLTAERVFSQTLSIVVRHIADDSRRLDLLGNGLA